jgi:hypothetical protein
MPFLASGSLMPRIVSLLLAAFWGVAAWQVFLIPESAIQMAVGAREVPAAVVVFLGAVIAVYAVGAWRGRQPDLRGEGGQEPERGALARTLWLLGGGAAFMALVQPLGFILPAALCGVGVARAFDAPLSWRTGLICLLIAGVFWVTFAAGLGVGLGPAFAGLG